jgi:quinol monooxygenase YgiN
MYGLIGQIVASPGKRDELAAVLLSMGAMPGCVSYIVAQDPSKPDAVWVTEVWETPEAHATSLELPSVQAGIERGRPLIVGFESRVETVPVGGIGLGELRTGE